MDEKDKKILNALSEDSSQTTREIAKKTRIPITTVHKRKIKLSKEGIIKRYTIDIDQSKLGKNLTSIVLITLDHKILNEKKVSPRDFASRLKSLDYVEKVFHVTGLADLVIIVRLKDTTELEQMLYQMKKQFEAIERTQTLVVMSEV